METLALTTEDGTRLVARCYWPRGEVRRAVLIAPAMAVAQSFYAAFAQWLADQGLATFTLDLRGIGESRRGSLRGLHADITQWAVQDLPALIRAMSERLAGGLPWSCLGHSLGGQIFGLMPGHERFERLVTVASGNGYWRYNATPTRYYAPILWHALARPAVALVGYFPGRRLGIIGDLPGAAMLQWRRWCLHPDYIGSEGPALRQQYAQVRTPTCAVIVEDDELLSPAGIRDLYRLYPRAAVQFETLKPADCGLKRIGHFGLFNPRAAPSLWPRALGWLHG